MSSSSIEKIGWLCIAVVGFQLSRIALKFIYRLIIGPQLCGITPDKFRAMGKWALVTGATDGVGKAYAENLAEKGLDIVLVSRSKDKLETVAGEIRDKYKVEAKIIEADFANASVYEHIEKQCRDLEIGVLINNVGASYPHPEYFLDVKDPAMFEHLFKLNVLSVTKMCQIILPGMVERQRGVVVNISSTTALIPSPLLTVYGATKAYVQKFTRDLAAEYTKSGVCVQCVLPGYVATKMAKIRKSTWMAPTPRTFVEHAIKTVGVEEETTGYWPHTLLVKSIGLMEFVSPSLSRWIVIRTMQNIRNRAVRKSDG